MTNKQSPIPMHKKNIVLYPVLFAVYPVLFLCSQNIGQTCMREILTVLAYLIVFFIVVWGFFLLILRDIERSGLVVSLFWLLFFSYGRFRVYLTGKWWVFLLCLTWAFVFVTAFHYIAAIRKPFRKTTSFLNIVASVLVLLCISDIILHLYKGSIQDRLAVAEDAIKVGSAEHCQLDNYADIYFIVLDAYARNDILAELYDYDNSRFLDYLKGSGFYIAERATANYCQTHLSIGSCLNMNYLDDMVKEIGENNKSHKYSRELIDNGFVKKYLRARGYSIINIGGKSSPDVSILSDLYLNTNLAGSAFFNSLENLTPLPDFFRLIGWRNKFDLHRNDVMYMLNSLKNIPQKYKSPKFVYAHINIPHPPFVFRQNGDPTFNEEMFSGHDGDWLIKKGRMSLEEYRRSYVEQLVFLNRSIKTVIKTIQSESTIQPVIILLSDHGPRSETVWRDSARTNVRECMSVLSAFYLAGQDCKYLYPEVSLVNFFRVIIKHCFNEDIDLLPDKNYFSSPEYLHRFYDVTERVLVIEE